MSRHWSFRIALAALLCLAAAANAWAQDAGAELNPIKWSLKAKLPPTPLKAGEQFTVELSAQIEKGWHLYSTEPVENGPKPTRITVPTGQAFEPAGEIESPAPFSAHDPNFGVEVEYYKESVTFTLPVRVLPSATAGSHKLMVQVRYQTCTEQLCLPPTLVKLEALAEVATASTASNKSQASSTAAGVSAPSQSLAVGAQVPDFSFTDFNGQAHRFSEYRGKYVLLDFWATWCSPCLADIPHLKELYAKYRGQGFEIIGMDSETLGQDAEDNDPEFAKEHDARARQIVSTRGASWTHATAATAVAERVFGVKILPAKILIDAQGKIVARVEEGKELDELLEKLLGGKR